MQLNGINFVKLSENYEKFGQNNLINLAKY